MVGKVFRRGSIVYSPPIWYSCREDFHYVPRVLVHDSPSKNLRCWSYALMVISKIGVSFCSNKSGMDLTILGIH